MSISAVVTEFKQPFKALTVWILTLEDGTLYTSPVRADLLLILALELGYV